MRFRDTSSLLLFLWRHFLKKILKPSCQKISWCPPFWWQQQTQMD